MLFVVVLLATVPIVVHSLLLLTIRFLGPTGTMVLLYHLNQVHIILSVVELLSLVLIVVYS